MSDTRTQFKRVDYDLSGLLNYIANGDIGLPDIQRPFVWKARQVRDLFDSMYRGFPVGYLLFWDNTAAKGNRSIGTDDKAHAIPNRLILDGQQRLTSLYSVLRGTEITDENYKKVRLEIAFRPTDGKFEVTDAAVRKDPEFISDISLIWASGHSSHKLVSNFLRDVRAKREVSDEEEETISHNLDRLFDLQKYPFTALEIASTVDEETAADIFVRINSGGVKLNAADFVLTLMTVFWPEGRGALEQFSIAAKNPAPAGKPSPYNPYIKPDADQLLRVSVGLGFHRARLQQVYSVLRGKDIETGQISDERNKQFDHLQKAQEQALDLQSWADFMAVLRRAGYLQAGMISSEIGLLYAYTFFLIGKHEYGVPNYELRNVLARWYFMTSLTARYSSSPETRMEQDLAALRVVRTADEFIGLLDRIVRDTLTEDFWNIRLPNNLVASAARTPSLFAYDAALVLLDARALFSKLKVADLLSPAAAGKKSAVERHHLFPKAYLTSIGITERTAMNQVSNFAWVEWFDNIKISDAPPSEYLPKYKARFSPEELAKMMYWHALPEGWENMSYADFLSERRKAMAQVVRDAFATLYN